MTTGDKPNKSAVAPDREALAQGLDNRRRVLGDAWVQRALNNANSLSVDFQRQITANVWDGIWSRPGIEPI